MFCLHQHWKVNSKCRVHAACQGLRSLELVLVKVNAIEQRMGVLDEFLRSVSPARMAGLKQETGTKGKVYKSELDGASLLKPVEKRSG